MNDQLYEHFAILIACLLIMMMMMTTRMLRQNGCRPIQPKTKN